MYVLTTQQHVSPWLLQELRLGSAHMARNIFYRRAKALFDFEVEADVYVRAQCALLLSCSSVTVDPTTSSSWLSSSLQHAQTLQAHNCHSPTGDAQLIADHKRLWWCLLLRDRILSLTLHRPLQIPPQVFNTDTALFEVADVYSVDGNTAVIHGQTRFGLPWLFETYQCLIDILTELSALVFSARVPGPASGTDAQLNLVGLWEYHASRLHGWRAQLGHCDACCHDPVSAFIVCMMELYYSTSIITLETQKVLLMSREPEGTGHGQYRIISCEIVSTAVQDAARVVRRLLVKDLARHLPGYVLPCLVTPLVLSGLDVLLCAAEGASLAAKQQFCQFTRAMALFDRQHDTIAGNGLDGVVFQIFQFLEAAVESRTCRDSSSSTTTSLANQPMAGMPCCAAKHLHPMTPPSWHKAHNWSDLALQDHAFFLELLYALHIAVSAGSGPIWTAMSQPPPNEQSIAQSLQQELKDHLACSPAVATMATEDLIKHSSATPIDEATGPLVEVQSNGLEALEWGDILADTLFVI
ncbi:hypothetical protein BJX65DRAFT_309863 [Aspergillus insuetus]